jgi:hypothetical protein
MPAEIDLNDFTILADYWPRLFYLKSYIIQILTNLLFLWQVLWFNASYLIDRKVLDICRLL